MEKEKKLAKLNGATNDLYKQQIIKRVREKYTTVDDEIAILRKMVVELAKKVKEQHPDIDLKDILDYDDHVESSKRIAKTELDLW